MITNEQWQLIDEKYGKLLITICNNISGDLAIASFDDNLQDLRIATMEAVKGFEKKEGVPFSEFWGTTGFHKYMKTCLWNLKNKKGAKITKKAPILRNTVDITEYGDVLIAGHQDTSGLSSVADLIKQSKANFDDRQKRLIDEVAKNPDYVKPNGKLNITKLSDNLGCCVATTKRTITQIKTKFNLDL